MMYIKNTKYLFSMLTIALLTFTSCNQDDDEVAQIGNNEDALFGFLTAVEDPDGRVNFLHTTTELGPDVKFDPSVSLELPGYSRFWAQEKTGKFYIGQSEDLTVTKWHITEDTGFEKGQTVSFQGEGTQQISQTMAIVSETKAYYIDFSQGQLIVINPEEMVIDKVIPLPAQMAPVVDGLNIVFESGKYHIVNDRLFIPVGWTDRESTLRQATGLAVVNTNTDQVTYTEDDRVATAFNVVAMDNGDLYFGASWPVVYDQEGREIGRKGGLLRIKAGETTFDPGYYIEYPKVGADIVKSPVANKVYLRVLDEEKMAWSGDNLANDYFDNVWQVALLDVGTGEMETVEALPYLIWFNTFQMDDRLFVETQEEQGDAYNNRIVKINEVTPDGKNFEQVYECSACRFIQEIARLR